MPPSIFESAREIFEKLLPPWEWMAFSSPQGVLSSPLTAISASIFLAALSLSGRSNVNLSRALLVFAWCIFAYGVSDQYPGNSFWFLAIGYTSLSLAAWVWVRPEAVPIHFGRFTPRRKLIFSSLGGQKASRLEIGKSGTIFQIAGNKPLFVTKTKQELLKIESIKGCIFVSAIIHDDNGNLVASIVRNNWKVAPSPNTWDRNYNKNALEVIAPTGNVILQVEILDDRVRFQGDIKPPGHLGLRFVENNSEEGGAHWIPFNNKGAQILQQHPIRPIFRYPSELHLGERTT